MSSFGQPFRAEIDLLGHKDELAALTSRLASPDTYQQVERQYVPALVGLSLDVRTPSNGKAYIDVSSSRSMNELYIDLLVEIQSGSTRLIRGYTALIDPAGFKPVYVTPSRVAVPETQTAPKAQSAASRAIAAYAADKTAAGNKTRVVRLSKSKPTSSVAVDSGEMRSLLNRIRVLEDKLILQKKVFAELNKRITLMENTAQVMQHSLESRKPDVAAVLKQAETEPRAQIPETTRAEVVVAAKPEGTPVDTRKAELKPPLPPEKTAVRAKPDIPVMKTVPPPAGPGLVDNILGERLYLVVGGSVILLGGLGLGLAFWMRRRRQSQEVTSEDILIKLLARDPGRDDVQIKLFEIYAARKDKITFNSAAGFFNKLTGGQGEAWLKVAAMGYALDPDNPLYESGKYAASAAAAINEVA